MAEFEDRSQKTEAPTPRRLERAREKGRVASSREVHSFFLLLAATVFLAFAGPRTGTLLLEGFRDALARAASAAPGPAVEAAVHVGARILLPWLGVLAVAAIGASAVQHAIVWSSEAIAPKLSRISPLAGARRLFSARSLVELAKNLAKLLLVGLALFIALRPEITRLVVAARLDEAALALGAATTATRLLIAATVAVALMALLDYAYQRAEFLREMRMSRQELREELKETEGDPLIRQRLRSLRMERARRRMMAEVPKSTVVITNPTHVAVALRYEAGRTAAPEVVAKGQDRLALRIREIARAHGVPVVENPPLARALYRATEVGEHIPAAHFEAVAKIIAHILALRGESPRPSPSEHRPSPGQTGADPARPE